MKFSIVIPLHNKAPYIACTLDSVLTQEFKDFEVLVVDDGSSDGGAQIVVQCNDARVRLLRQANAGVAAARNRGIAQAQGQWVCFLDADDWLHPAYLSTLVHAQAQFPQADVVAADFIRVPHTAGPWPKPWAVTPQPAAVELITRLARRWMQGPTLSSSSVAVRRSRLMAMQPCFAPGESLGEDLDLWFRLAELSPVALAHKPLVAYRVQVQDSLSSRHGSATHFPFLERLRQRSAQLSAQGRRDTLWLVAQHEISLAREALQAGHRDRAWRWLLRAHRAMTGRRWWFTLIMAAFIPKRWIDLAMHWRERAGKPNKPAAL